MGSHFFGSFILCTGTTVVKNDCEGSLLKKIWAQIKHFYYFLAGTSRVFKIQSDGFSDFGVKDPLLKIVVVAHFVVKASLIRIGIF